MDSEKIFIIQSICEAKLFDKLKLLISGNVSKVYNIKIINILNHSHYFLKITVKTTSDKCKMLCEILQEYEFIITNCQEIAFPSYLVRISGDMEKCLNLHKKILNSFINSGALPIKSEIISEDFITAICDIVVTNKDPLKCTKFLELIKKEDLTYKVIPIESYGYY